MGGITVGKETVRAVIYADDISPVNSCPEDTNAALQAISTAGTFNAYKFKPSKCKIIGSDKNFEGSYSLGQKIIERVECGLLLGVVIHGRGINVLEHVRRRAKMVDTSIKLIKFWRTKGLSFRVAFKHLFLSKLVPRFTYAFSLLNLTEWGVVHDLIRKTLEKALCCTFGWSVPKRLKLKPGVWFMACGFPSVFALLRKLKLDMAGRLKVGDNKAARIFQNLYASDRGSFESDVHVALKEWLLLGLWGTLKAETLKAFKSKISILSKKCWPEDLQMKGNLTWLYHNHRVFSGNVPMWADWVWPKGQDMNVFQSHFHCLLLGEHPAGGSEASCVRLLCRSKNKGPIYNHHFFECGNYLRNRIYFQNCARNMYDELVADGNGGIPRCVIDEVLEKPCGMWVGLFEPCLFEFGLKLSSLHELHRIVTIANVMSWGRFYTLPKAWSFSR